MFNADEDYMNNLIAWYKQRLNLQNADFRRIGHVDAMVAIVYEVKIKDKSFLLKICPRSGDFLREVYFLKYFADSLPVANIINIIPPEPEIFGAILMEYLPGALLKTMELTDALAYEIGALLARIHLNRAEGFGDLTPTKFN